MRGGARGHPELPGTQTHRQELRKIPGGLQLELSHIWVPFLSEEEIKVAKLQSCKVSRNYSQGAGLLYMYIFLFLSPKLYLDVLNTISDVQGKYIIWYMRKYKRHRCANMRRPCLNCECYKLQTNFLLLHLIQARLCRENVHVRSYEKFKASIA